LQWRLPVAAGRATTMRLAALNLLSWSETVRSAAVFAVRGCRHRPMGRLFSWETVRIPLMIHDRFNPQLGKKRCRSKHDWWTLNQRVQGSSPCAPTKPINVLGQDRAPTVKSGGTIWGTALGGQPWPLVGHTVSGQFPTRRGCAPVVAPGARIARRSPRGEPTGNV
jgi:hypothetical protein